jgi:hypothetical protein
VAARSAATHLLGFGLYSLTLFLIYTFFDVRNQKKSFKIS